VNLNPVATLSMGVPGATKASIEGSRRTISISIPEGCVTVSLLRDRFGVLLLHPETVMAMASRPINVRNLVRMVAFVLIFYERASFEGYPEHTEIVIKLPK
jgi:hypothetical protein